MRGQVQFPRMDIDRTELSRFQSALRIYLRRRMRDEHEVEDVVQEAIARLYACAPDAAVVSPLGYLFRIVRNLLIDRSRRWSPLTTAVPIEDEPGISVEPQQEYGRHHEDLRQAYERALTELSPRCREVFHLRRHQELGTPEIATRLSISPRMVQKYMVRAMTHLHDRLGPFLRGVSEPDARVEPSVPVSFQSASSSW